MDEDFSITLHADTARVDAELDAVEARLRRLNREVDDWGRKVRISTMRGLSALSATVNVFQLIGSYFPSALSPIFNAAMTAIATSVASMQAIAAAYAAGGVTAPLAAIVEGAAIGLAIVGFFEVWKGQLATKAELDRMNSLLRNMGTAITSWGRFAGSLG